MAQLAATRNPERLAVVAGRHDLVDPPASLEANLLPVIPGARMTVFDRTAHLSPLEVLVLRA